MTKIVWWSSIIVGICLRAMSAFMPNSLWDDEMAVLTFSRLPILEGFLRDNSPPLFRLLLRYWDQLLPSTEYMLRALPFLISTISILIVFKKIKNIFFLVFFAMLPSSVVFAGDLKSSCLFELSSILFTILAFDIFSYDKNFSLEMIAENKWKWLLASAFLPLTSYFGVLFILSFLILLLFQQELNFKIKKHLGLCLFILILMISIFYNFFVHHKAIAWTKLEGNFDFIFFMKQIFFVAAGQIAWLGILCALIILYALKTLKMRKFILWFAILIAIYSVVSVLTHRNLAIDRFLFPIFILIYIIISELLMYLYSKNMKAISASIAMLFVSALFFSNYKFLNKPRSGWKEAAQVACTKQSDLPIYIWGHDSYEYYFPKSCATILSYSQGREPADHGYLIVSKSVSAKIENYPNSKLKLINKTEFGADSFYPVIMYEYLK